MNGVLFREQQKTTAFYIVKSGSFRVSVKDPHRKGHSIDLLTACDGQTLGEEDIVNGNELYTTTAVCICQKAELIKIAKDDFQRFMQYKEPWSAIQMLSQFKMKKQLDSAGFSSKTRDEVEMGLIDNDDSTGVEELFDQQKLGALKKSQSEQVIPPVEKTKVTLKHAVTPDSFQLMLLAQARPPRPDTKITSNPISQTHVSSVTSEADLYEKIKVEQIA